MMSAGIGGLVRWRVAGFAAIAVPTRQVTAIQKKNGQVPARGPVRCPTSRRECDTGFQNFTTSMPCFFKA
jgi:hypothetical protein